MRGRASRRAAGRHAPGVVTHEGADRGQRAAAHGLLDQARRPAFGDARGGPFLAPRRRVRAVRDRRLALPTPCVPHRRATSTASQRHPAGLPVAVAVVGVRDVPAAAGCGQSHPPAVALTRSLQWRACGFLRRARDPPMSAPEIAAAPPGGRGVSARPAKEGAGGERVPSLLRAGAVRDRARRPGAGRPTGDAPPAPTRARPTPRRLSRSCCPAPCRTCSSSASHPRAPRSAGRSGRASTPRR